MSDVPCKSCSDSQLQIRGLIRRAETASRADRHGEMRTLMAKIESRKEWIRSCDHSTYERNRDARQGVQR